MQKVTPISQHLKLHVVYLIMPIKEVLLYQFGAYIPIWRHTQELNHLQMERNQQENNSQGNLAQDQFHYILKDRLTAEEITELQKLKETINLFISKHTNKPLIFLTSGGTSVPLQKNSVRLIQNFSTGLRGSILAEQILSHDLPLIFFYRQNSHLPFTKGISLNSLFKGQSSLQALEKSIKKFKEVQQKILLIPFKTIYKYLNGITIIKELLPKNSILILCAAVSDFIPSAVPTHKIHTSSDLNLQLINSPKVLGKMTSPEHLSVSFKLQTDEQKVNERMQFAIKSYGVDLVIGNILNNKNWISINYNPANFQQKHQEVYNGNAESIIIERILAAHKEKFKLDN